MRNICLYLNFLSTSISKTLLPIEKLAGVFFLFVLGFYIYTGNNPPVLGKYYLGQLVAGLQGYLAGLIIVFIYTITKAGIKKDSSIDDAIKKYTKVFFRPREVLSDVRYINGLILIVFFYVLLKHLVPVVNDSIFDSWFYTTEKSFLGGKIASVWIIDLLGKGTAPFMSGVYQGFYLYMNIVCCVFVIVRDKELKNLFSIAFALAWMIGIGWIYLMPTWGPCFYKAELFSVLPVTDTKNVQDILWSMKLALDNSFDSTNLFSISGVPSLHIAIVTVGSIFLIKLSKFVALLSWIFFSCTCLSTLYFGWHYLLDDVGGVILGWLCCLAAPSIVRLSSDK